MKRAGLWALVWILFPASLCAQTYLWPTSASKWLTSAFAETRPRRFHAGIDIKTWNRTGYEVYASRAGSIWRVRVSPFGYGRVLYLKADTGEILVYAHLDRFAPKIEQIIEAEQERTGRYLVTRTFSAGAIPVAQGEVIAYTGETGVGVPHLHFEIRDSRNRPTNPLLKNFDIPDDRRPIIRAVSAVPLGADGRVKGDVRPVVLPARLVRPGEYVLSEPLSISGMVGLGVSTWDKPGPVSNRTGVYELRLFIDGRRHFQARYDAFDFANNRFVELDRSFLLARRGYGAFYNLFRHPANRLPFYLPRAPWAGALSAETLTVGQVAASSPAAEGQDGLGPSDGERVSIRVPNGTRAGEHAFVIEAADFWGNRSRVSGTFFYGPTFGITAEVVNASGEVRLRRVQAQGPVKLTRLEASLSLNGGRSWRRLSIDQRWPIESDGEGIPLLKVRPRWRNAVIKLVAFSQEGIPSYPVFAPLGTVPVTRVEVESEFYPRMVRLQVDTEGIPRTTPKLMVRTETGDRRHLSMHAVSPQKFVGVLPMDPGLEGTNRIEVYLNGTFGDSLVATRVFYARRVAPGRRAAVYSSDGLCWVEFSARSAYAPFYSRVEFEPITDPDSASVRGIYVVEPHDEPLNQGAQLFIRYPAKEPPEKLGIYYEEEPGEWVFVDNQIDTVRETISARVFSLERFALRRDTQPPIISSVYPADGARLRNRRPWLRAGVKDEGSGLVWEEKVYLQLDGRRVPAEYDPEADLLRYRPKTDLEPGAHTLTVTAEDRNGNFSFYETTFWIQ